MGTIVNADFLTKSHGISNLVAFKTLRAIPFLAEVAAIISWMFTETTLVVSEWMTLWSIEGLIFELKCWRNIEKKYKAPRGQVQLKSYKYLVGGGIVLLVVLIIWFPLLVMNVVLTIAGVPNNPSALNLKISIDAYEPLISVSAQNSSISTLPQAYMDSLRQQYKGNQKAEAYLSDFTIDQMRTITVNGDSQSTWKISPPQEERLIKKLNGTSRLQLSLEWTIFKNPELQGVYIASGKSNYVISNKNTTIRHALREMLTTTNLNNFVTIPGVLPRFIHSQVSSSAAVVPKALTSAEEPLLLPLNIRLQMDNKTQVKWWGVSTNKTDSKALKIVVFSDKVSPESLDFIVNYGIIGLYVSVVLVAGRLFRTFYISLTETIMFRQLPTVDRIIGLCNDILLVRELGDFELEEDLFAKLIYLFRSPSTLLTFTKKFD